MPFTENSWPKAIIEIMYLAILASVAEQVFYLSFGKWHEDQEHQIVKSLNVACYHDKHYTKHSVFYD